MVEKKNHKILASRDWLHRGGVNTFEDFFFFPAPAVANVSAFLSLDSQHSRVHTEAAEFHHKLKFGMQELSLQQTFSLRKVVSL